MKTKKQIQICGIEEGHRLAEKARLMDRIVVSEATLEQLKEMSDLEHLDNEMYYPILKTGVLEFETGGGVCICWKADIQENGSMSLDVETFCKNQEFSDGTKDIYWLYSATASVWIEEDGFNVRVSEITDPAMHVFERQKLTRLLDSRMDKAAEYATNSIAGLSVIFFGINYFLRHPAEKVVQRRPAMATPEDRRKSLEKTHSGSGKRTSAPRTLIMMNNIRIFTNESNAIRKLVSRKYVRTAEGWSVRGHWRHLKSGKTIFVRPYEKGSGRGEARTYRPEFSEPLSIPN